MLYNTLFDLISEAVKSKEELSMVTCIYSGRREISQNPVCGFTLVFEAGAKRYINAAENSDRREVAEVKLCLLAPSGAGGKRLAEVADWIAQAVKENKAFEEYSEIIISKPSYNETSAVLSTDIIVSFSRIAVTDPDTMVFIDGKYVERMVSFSVESKENSEKEGELLNGYSFDDKVCYSINLSAEVPLRNVSGEFVLRLRASETTEEYRGCRVKSYSCKYISKNKMLFSYSITATERSE